MKPLDSLDKLTMLKDQLSEFYDSHTRYTQLASAIQSSHISPDKPLIIGSGNGLQIDTELLKKI